MLNRIAGDVSRLHRQDKTFCVDIWLFLLSEMLEGSRTKF